MQIEGRVLSRLGMTIPERPLSFWVDYFANTLSLDSEFIEEVWNYISLTQIKYSCRVDEERATNVFCIFYYLIHEKQRWGKKKVEIDNLIEQIIPPNYSNHEFEGIYSDFKKKIHRIDDFIPTLIDKIKSNTPLNEYDKTYPLYSQYSDKLKEVCMTNPGRTAQKVLKLIKDASFIGKPDSNFKIWL